MKLKQRGLETKAISRDSSAFVSVSAGLFSTVRDYLRFQQMLMNRGVLYGQRILSAETVDLMISNQVGDLKENVAKGGPNHGTGFTIGLVMEPDDPGRIASFGFGGASGVSSRMIPSEGLSIVYMVQQPSDLPNKIYEAVHEAIID